MKLDTQFTGGVILRYTYTGKADTGQIQKEVEDIVDRSVSVQTSENSATGEKSLVITLSGKKGLTPEQQKEILNTINQGNKNQFETSETSAVEPYIEEFGNCDCSLIPLHCGIYPASLFGIGRSCIRSHSCDRACS